MMIEQSSESNHKSAQQSNSQKQQKNASQKSNSNSAEQALKNKIMMNNNNEVASKNILLQVKNNSSSSYFSRAYSKPPCINKICSKFKNSKHHLKSYPFNQDDLCKECLQQYKKDSYCVYCKQIYFDSSDDGKQWILCEACGRWVHSECANFDPANDQLDFKCLICKKADANTEGLNLRQGNPRKTIVKGNPSSKTSHQRRNKSQCNLNAFGFYWQLTPAELAEDMDKIRQFLQ